MPAESRDQERLLRGLADMKQLTKIGLSLGLLSFLFLLRVFDTRFPFSFSPPTVLACNTRKVHHYSFTVSVHYDAIMFVIYFLWNGGAWHVQCLKQKRSNYGRRSRVCAS